MTFCRFSPEAFDLAHHLILQDSLWERPQVEGITIDGPDSRDLDDAIWIEPTPTGAILSIHIADVSELVTIGSALDKEAISRTQTRYFGVGNAPMLPRPLSEDKLSLWEYQDRPTLTVQITLNDAAEIEQTEIYESWLRSRKKFHYREAEQDQKDPSSPFSELLQTAQAWAELLYRKRLKTGAIGATQTAQGDWLTEEGSLIRGKRRSSHLLIQEFMILANRAVAQWLAEQDVPMLYRNHTARAIAPDRETMYQEMLLLRSAEDVRKRMGSWLNRAEYGPTLVGHFALALPAYTHFTSPIRRLADLINHRIVKAILKNQDAPYSKADLEQLGQHIANVTREYEEKASHHFRSVRHREYDRQLQYVEELGQLSDKAFSRLLKHAINQGELERITDEVIARMGKNRLALQDLYLLIFESGHVDLKQRAIASLAERGADAASIIAMALDWQPTWEGCNYVEPEQPPFITWLEVTIAGQVLTTVEAAVNPRKQTARHHACYSWIVAYGRGELVSPQHRVTPVMVESESPASESKSDPLLQKVFKDGQNFIGMLYELCQHYQWSQPTYDITELEDGFECCCVLNARSETWTGVGAGRKKKQAKQRASQQILEQLQRQVQ